VKKLLVICLAVCFAVMGISGVASAATKSGDSTVFGTLSYDASEFSGEGGSLDFSTFTASAGLGRFFTDSFQVELGLIGQSMTISEFGEDMTLQQMGLQVRPNFHFNTDSSTVPYVGLALGYLWVDFFEEDTGAFLYGGQAGIKQFVTENAYLQIEAGYTASTIEIGDEDIDVGDLRLSVGVGCKF